MWNIRLKTTLIMKVRITWSKTRVWYICVTVGLMIQMLIMMYHLHYIQHNDCKECNLIQNTMTNSNMSPMQNYVTRKPTTENTSIKKNQPTKAEGYARARRLWERCGGYHDRKRRPGVNFLPGFTTRIADVQVCPIGQAGAHTLRRIFILNADEKYKNLTNPYDIPQYYNAPYIYTDRISNKPTTKRYLFVRDPYKRLLSVYIDKVLAPNTYYWSLLGSPAISTFRKNASAKSLDCGHDTTFREYVKYVILVLNPVTKTKDPILSDARRNHDAHYKRYTDSCQPCHAKYDFIGTMETFDTDILDLLEGLHLNDTKNLLIHRGSELAALDAIRHTSYQPFDPTFTEKLNECMGPYNALKRAWLVLQIRGLIGEKPLPVVEPHAEHVTRDQFLQMAFRAREESSKTERSELKNDYLKKCFNTLSNGEMQQLSEIYDRDLELFEYEKIPMHLFV